MALQFILGRSGTGKTTLCIKQITESLLETNEPCHQDGRAKQPRPQGSGLNKTNLVYLVPEQATYQAERAIMSDDRIKGYSRLHILSFQRLCYMIFGKNLAARPLTAQAREMIVHRLLCENAGKLSVFAWSAERPGTAVSIGATICELQQYGKSPDDIEKFIARLDDSKTSELTSAKLSDINLIYKQYLDFVEGRFFNNDNQLNLAKASVGQADFLKGCKLWVDGFAGFTTSELNLLCEVLKVSSSAKIALCLDAAEINRPDSLSDVTSIFYPTLQTYRQLKASGLKEEKPIVLAEPRRFEKSKAIGRIEKNIFSFEDLPTVSAGGNIKITPCAKIRTEVDYVARQICSLIREQNFSWRDIAVIASDIDAYRHYIQAIFTDFKIPFFVDRRRDLQQYPAVELITSALKIAGDRFTTADVINYLKSDLVAVSRGEVDRLENYCLAFNIETDDWLRDLPWVFAPADDEDFNNKQIESIRQKATKQLLHLRQSLQSGGAMKAEEFCSELFGFLDRLGVREHLQSWTEAAFQQARLDEAQLHQQFFAQFTQLMDDFLYIFKNIVVTAKQCASIISSAFSQMTAALIPPALDQVLVGSIERSRHPELKAVFLIGAADRQFPVPVHYDNILNDKDRRIASEADFELARSGTMQLVDRRYLAYIAFTRPSRFLYITYPMTDEKGNEVQCSFLVNQLRALFSDLREEKYFGSDSADDIYTVSDLTVLVASRLGRDNSLPANEFDAKCRWLCDEMAANYGLAKVKSAIEYSNTARLDEKTAGKLFASALSTSATRLKSFANCPYQHFAAHIMKLQERRSFEMEPLNLGRFYHGVLELLSNELKSDGFSLSTVRPESLALYADKSVEEFIVKNSFLKNFRNKSNHNGYIIESASEIIREAVVEFSQIARAGEFVQIASELKFGSKSILPAIEIELENGEKLHLEGKIDRVDIVCKAGTNYAVVFDYKTSETAVSYSLLKAGLDLQLPIYLLALNGRGIDKHKELVPLGAFYLPIQASYKNGVKEKRKPKGVFNGEFFNLIDCETETGYSSFYNFQVTKDNKQFGRYETSSLLYNADFSKLLSFTKNKLKELGGRITAGTIDINPYKYIKKIPCTHCPYKPVCRFDWQMNEYRNIEKFSKTEFFKTVE
ncbi:MAG: exodeoxyribonuclease V subunit gamma [Phycisphaerae bacterium]|nr:exodeoxyribonuclease V subunit gamma [Phycisphaerae bacterium]